MKLFKIIYQLHNGIVVKYVISEDQLEAINKSRPVWDDKEPREFTSVKIEELCWEKAIIK